MDKLNETQAATGTKKLREPFLSKKQYTAVGVTFVLAFVGLVYLFFMPFTPGGQVIKIGVEEKDSFGKVIEKLEEKGIVGSRFLAKTAGFLLGADKRMKPGVYKISQEISYISLMSLLVSNEFDPPHTLELYNGITINGIANRFKQAGSDSADEFRQLLFDSSTAASFGIPASNFEGYLLPQTIKFLTVDPPSKVLKRLFDLNSAVFTGQVLEDMKKSGLTKHEILTLASIISRESKFADEMPRVSGVYHNRLKKKMKLQADPSVQYAIGEARSRITGKDLKIDSPYNTYKYEGLPPGPIGNPSKEAILAAVYPEEHEYIYFVSDTKGRHIFTKTYQEHAKYARQYHQWLDSLNITR